MYTQIPNASGGFTWVFTPDVVPPSISEIEHEKEAAERAAEGRRGDDVSPDSIIAALLASYPAGLRNLIDSVGGVEITLTPGATLCGGWHGDTDDQTTPMRMELPEELATTRAPPSPGGRRVEETPSLPGVFDHEIGHVIEAAFEAKAQERDTGFSLEAIYAGQEDAAAGISQYAMTDRHEWFAECFAAWLHPEPAGFQIDPGLRAMLDAVCGLPEGRTDSAATTSAGGGLPDALADTQPAQIRGAGVLLLHKADDGERALFIKHKERQTWEFPGGVVEDGENAETAAEREVGEEIGASPYGRLSLLMRDRLSGVDYSTFQARVHDAFTPTVSDELEGFAWAPITQPPEPLHPGVRLVLERLRMNELDIARAIADGRLSSPQQYENIWLFAMRVTGTGASYRPELNEHVWRPPDIYLNPEFLERCNGLPVIWQHPPGDELTQREFENRVIGTIMKAYIHDDEVWSVTRIYDNDAASMMLDMQLSTSPAVVFRDPSVNEERKLEGGRTLLIEGNPSLLDHLAVCEMGVWDRGGTATGIARGEPERAEGPATELPEEVNVNRLDSIVASLGEMISRLE